MIRIAGMMMIKQQLIIKQYDYHYIMMMIAYWQLLIANLKHVTSSGRSFATCQGAVAGVTNT